MGSNPAIPTNHFKDERPGSSPGRCVLGIFRQFWRSLTPYLHCTMTLIVAAVGPESLWLLADRRLSYVRRPPRDDATKIMILETTHLPPVTSGRDDWIRTSDPLTPSQVRYQAALHPES